METNEIIQETEAAIEEETIDLRGNVSHNAPQENKYKPILFAGILTIPVLLIMMVAGRLFHIYVMEYSTDALFFGLLFVSVPFILASIPFLLHAKAKFKRADTKRKPAKGTAALLYVSAILTVAITMVCGFSNAFSTMGILSKFSGIMFVIMAIFLVVCCNMISNQSGVEAYYCFAKAMMVAFIVSSPVGFIIGMILRMMELALIAFVIAIIAFFLFGGRIIFYRRG